MSPTPTPEKPLVTYHVKFPLPGGAGDLTIADCQSVEAVLAVMRALLGNDVKTPDRLIIDLVPTY